MARLATSAVTAPRNHRRSESVTNASNQATFKQPARLKPAHPSLGKTDAQTSIGRLVLTVPQTSIFIPSVCPFRPEIIFGLDSPFYFYGHYHLIYAPSKWACGLVRFSLLVIRHSQAAGAPQYSFVTRFEIKTIRSKSGNLVIEEVIWCT